MCIYIYTITYGCLNIPLHVVLHIFFFRSVLKKYGGCVAKALHGANQLLCLEAKEQRVDEKVMASTPRP